MNRNHKEFLVYLFIYFCYNLPFIKNLSICQSILIFESMWPKGYGDWSTTCWIQIALPVAVNYENLHVAYQCFLAAKSSLPWVAKMIHKSFTLNSSPLHVWSKIFRPTLTSVILANHLCCWSSTCCQNSTDQSRFYKSPEGGLWFLAGRH